MIKFPKRFRNPGDEEMAKYCMLKTRAVTAPCVAEQILIYSEGPDIHDCFVVFLSLCARACPPVVLSSLWQGFQDGVHLLSDCCQRKLKLVLKRAKGSREKRGGGCEKWEGDSWTIIEVHLWSAQVVQRHKQTGGTLVRTKPGLWSLMCSSEAAMSISFTPDNKNSKSITITVWESS